MSDVTEKLLLDIIQEQRSQGERLSSIESCVKSLVGNGQPGIISKIQDDVSSLQKWRYYVIGAACGCGTVVEIIWRFLFSQH